MQKTWITSGGGSYLLTDGTTESSKPIVKLRLMKLGWYVETCFMCANTMLDPMPKNEEEAMKYAEQWALDQVEKTMGVFGAIAAFLKGNVDEADFETEKDLSEEDNDEK